MSDCSFKHNTQLFRYEGDRIDGHYYFLQNDKLSFYTWFDDRWHIFTTDCYLRYEDYIIYQFEGFDDLIECINAPDEPTLLSRLCDLLPIAKNYATENGTSEHFDTFVRYIMKRHEEILFEQREASTPKAKAVKI